MGYLVTYLRQILDAVAHKLESLYVHPAELYWKCLQVVTGKTKATHTVNSCAVVISPSGNGEPRGQSSASFRRLVVVRTLCSTKIRRPEIS
jgi:hypothetical protein